VHLKYCIYLREGWIRKKIRRIKKMAYGEYDVFSFNWIMKIHRYCFYECSELSEIVFHGVTEIEKEAYAECSLTVVRLTPGLHLDYTFPPGCRIEYVGAMVETPGRDSQNWSSSPERYSAISEWTIPHDSEYEEFRCVGSAVKLYRQLRTGEEIAVRSLPAPSRRVEITEVQNRFVRELRD
jgi:hypothetical protein